MGSHVGTTKRADAHDPVVANADEEIHMPVQGTVILSQAAHVDLHVTDWVTAQQENPNTQVHDRVDLWPESAGSQTPIGR